ncbi:hypothetical protein [Ktedonobacter racemifer]|uniref:hypothetical protein n=1 Tax=Ktedonobacter racemifer TaxID=363277 RepID=UPI000698AE5A|nr:hypothetical protein [Ktedonobacter racemifer]
MSGDTTQHQNGHLERRGKGKRRAVMAVAHSFLVIAYHVLREKKPYEELGPDYFDRLDTERTQHYHVRCLEQLGFNVKLAPAHIA